MPHDDDGVSLSLLLLDPSAIAITFFLRIFHARIANAAKNSAEIKTQGGMSAVWGPARPPEASSKSLLIPSRQIHQNEVAAAHVSLDRDDHASIGNRFPSLSSVLSVKRSKGQSDRL